MYKCEKFHGELVVTSGDLEDFFKQALFLPLTEIFVDGIPILKSFGVPSASNKNLAGVMKAALSEIFFAASMK